MDLNRRPLIRVKPKDLTTFGVERVPRVTGVQSGLPNSRTAVLSTSPTWCGARDSTPGSPGSTFRYWAPNLLDGIFGKGVPSTLCPGTCGLMMVEICP